MNYQRLEEECWQSEVNLAAEIRNNAREREAHNTETGFRREKKIFDDDNQEMEQRSPAAADAQDVRAQGKNLVEKLCEFLL